MKTLLLIDNFDSFTHNLVHSFKAEQVEVKIFRSNQLTVSKCFDLEPQGLVIGPGPGGPESAGLSNALIRAFSNKIPVFGVCLGHQCIGEVFGGVVQKAIRPMHGKMSKIYHNNKGIFNGLPQEFFATRYHSLVVDRLSLPSCLEVSAWTDEGEIMGLQHVEFPVFGVQFHPESVLTTQGQQLIKKFIRTYINP